MTDKILRPGEINLDYLPNDWPYTPLSSNKAPYVKGWQNNPCSKEEIKEEVLSGQCKAIGLLSGPVFNSPVGLVWVDVDGPSVYPLIEQISDCALEDALPPTLTICSGKIGRERKLYQLSKDDWKLFVRNKYTWHAEEKGEKLEVLWKKHQGVLMGQHPETDGYFTPEGLDFQWINSIEQLPRWILNNILNKNMKMGKPASQQTRIVGPNFAINAKISLERDIQLATEATLALPPEAAEDYDIWISVGQSLHTLDDSLLSLWDEWSKQSTKYREGDCQKKWRSFSKEGGIGVGTLIHTAQEYGWKPSQDHKAMPVDDQLLEEAARALKDFEKEAGIPAPELPARHKIIKKAWQHKDEDPELDDQENKKGRNASVDVITDALLQSYQGIVRFSSSHNQFLMYGIDSPGLWSCLSEIAMKSDIDQKLSVFKHILLPKGYGPNLINDIYTHLKIKLDFDGWDEATDLLLFKNGILDITDMKFHLHSKEFYITQQQPYEYDPNATCEPIIHWLKETQDNNWGRVQVLRAWLRAVLLGCSDLQKFLELVGPGKSGKSSFATLAHALVGNDNVVVSSLEHIEKSRFETAQFYGKKLALFNDVERYGGSVATLKALTGGDLLRNEHKFQGDQLKPFRFDGQVIMTANEPIQTTDHTSGLARRRLTIPFDNPFRGNSAEQKVLIGVDRKDQAYGEFAPLLPGLANWLLDMSETDMREYLLETGARVPFFRKYHSQQQLKSNPIKDWMDHCVVYAPNHATVIGKKKDASSGSGRRYDRETEWLYASYCEFCFNSGNNVMGRKRFEGTVLEICQHQLNLNAYLIKTHDAVVICNLALRFNQTKPEYKNYPSIIDIGDNREMIPEFYGDIDVEYSKKNKVDDSQTKDTLE